MESNVKNILMVGVGGQGTILVSKILTNGLLKAGYDVKMSEIHGMAQRGGSVSTTVRYGAKVYSPVIGRGAADVLVSFEKMEAVRWAEFLKPDGIAVINDFEIASLPIAIGAAEYPPNTIEAMEKSFKTSVVDAQKIAEECGNSRTMNVVLLGALIAAFKLTQIDWDEILKENIPAKMLDVNLKALHRGMEITL